MNILPSTTKYDEELEKWIAYVKFEDMLLPVGVTIDEKLEIFELFKFDTKEDAIKWITKQSERMTYVEDLTI